MTEYPPLTFLVAQALAVSLVTSVPLLAVTVRWELLKTLRDAGLGLAAFLAFALTTFLAFALFEGGWAAALFGPLADVRMPILGALGLTVAMGWQYVGTTAGRARLRSVPLANFGATLLAGAFWGALWQLAGWCLESFGMLRDG